MTITSLKQWAAVLLAVLLAAIVYWQFFGDSFLQNSNASFQEIAAKAEESCRPEKLSAAESKEVCYAKAFEEIAFAYGPEYAFDVLSVLQKIDPDARGCHFITHGVGYGTWKRDSENWREHIATISPVCSYGGPMGIIEQYTATLPTGTITKEFVPTICGLEPRADCNHIVGHILLADSSIKGNINKALELCSVLQDNPRQHNFCITGVFMEHITAFNLIEHGYAPERFLNWSARIDDLEQLCRSYKGEFAEACWEEIAHVAAVKFKNDAEKVFTFCNGAPEKEARQRCVYHSIGIMAGSQNFKIDLLKYMCGTPLPEHYDFPNRCYVGLVSSILSSIPKELSNVINFCASLEMEFKKTCFERVGNARHDSVLSLQEWKGACQAAPQEFQDQCSGDQYGNSKNIQVPRSDLNLNQ